MRELSGPLSLLIEMVTYCSYCNEPFSLGVLQFLKVRATGAGTLESMPIVLTIPFLCLSDPAGDGATS